MRLRRFAAFGALPYLWNRPLGAARVRRVSSGFSLPELLVAISLLGVVVAALMGVFIRQQRFYTGAAEVIETRSNLRQAVDILPNDLRAISPASGDIYAMSASSIEFRASLGASVVCTIANAGRTNITIPPVQLAARNGLTAWVAQPQSGDSLEIYDPGVNPDSSDDIWRMNRLASAPAANGNCPASTGFTSSVAEAARGYALELDSALTATMLPGSPIRFFRRARYELYESGIGDWYLGFADCLSSRATPCGAIQPVSGPYSGPGGIVFTYFDDAGVATNTRTSVQRIDVFTRARTRGAIRMDGFRTGIFRDSLAMTINVRN